MTNTANECVTSESDDAAAHHHSHCRRDGSWSAPTNSQIVSALVSTSSPYARASCEYQTSSGLAAAAAAASSAARRDTSRAPIAYATGTVAVPNSADSERMPASEVPKTLVHSQART